MTEATPADLFSAGEGAVLSPCGLYRYRLERAVADAGPTYAFFGVNPSKADASIDDSTVRKWRGFVRRWGGRRFVVGNPFAYRATDVRKLADVADPVGPDNWTHLEGIVAEADVLVPCWGDVAKVPRRLRCWFATLGKLLVTSGKPVQCFGLTLSGCPMHPLMLGYDTPLVPWPTP